MQATLKVRTEELRVLNRNPLGVRYNRHHRKALSRGGENTPENVSLVPEELHMLYNRLFGASASPQEVCNTLNQIWIDRDYQVVVIPKEAKFVVVHR